MTRILVLVHVFPPDNVATAQLYGDLVADLQAMGNEITVITTRPYYSLDLHATRWHVPASNHGKLIHRTDHDGVVVYRIWMPQKGRRILHRVVSWGWYHVLSTLLGLVGSLRPSVVLTASPPLSMGVCARLVAARHRVRYVYNAQELYPDVAINLGAVKNRHLIRALCSMERYVYAKAAQVTVISQRMKGRLLAKGVPGESIAVIPNFADTDFFRPMPKDNPFSREHDLSDKFVVSYAGNMGKPQHLDALLFAAAQLQSEDRVRFLFVGDGAERATLVALATKQGLRNVLFLPYQSYTRMNEIYATSDVSYVPQAPGTSCDGVPSKVYRIMCSARPVLASTDVTSDLAEMVRASGAGAVVPAGDPNSVAAAIRNAFASGEEWLAKGECGRSFIAANFSRSRISQRYNDLLNTVAKASQTVPAIT